MTVLASTDNSENKIQPTCCELSLHLLKNGVLGCGLSTAGQRLRGSAGEHGGNIGDILQADTKGANQLLDEVECVWRDLGIRHSAALLKCHRVAFSKALLELPQDLQGMDEGKENKEMLKQKETEKIRASFVQFQTNKVTCRVFFY